MDFVINTKEDILEELALLFDRIERIERNIESMTSDSMDRISECNENVCGLYSELSELYENIVSEIQIDIEMLEEDLGIEFDVKGKFKELLKDIRKVNMLMHYFYFIPLLHSANEIHMTI